MKRKNEFFKTLTEGKQNQVFIFNEVYKEFKAVFAEKKPVSKNEFKTLLINYCCPRNISVEFAIVKFTSDSMQVFKLKRKFTLVTANTSILALGFFGLAFGSLLKDIIEENRNKSNQLNSK